MGFTMFLFSKMATRFNCKQLFWACWVVFYQREPWFSMGVTILSHNSAAMALCYRKDKWLFECCFEISSICINLCGRTVITPSYALETMVGSILTGPVMGTVNDSFAVTRMSRVKRSSYRWLDRPWPRLLWHHRNVYILFRSRSSISPSIS